MQEKISIVQVGGSVEQALKGDYAIEVKSILSEAWQQTLKSRLSINLGIGFVIVLGMLVSLIVSHYVGGIDVVLQDTQASMILNVVVTIAIWPFMAGIEMMGVLHAVGLVSHPKLVFGFLKRGSWVALCALLTSLLISVGLQLLIFPGVFLAVVLSLTIPLVVEKELSPIRAIIISIQALRFKWLQILTLYTTLFMALVLLILPIVLMIESSLAPVSIGLFLFGASFLAPLYYNVKGILYREIFGVQITSNSGSHNRPAAEKSCEEKHCENSIEKIKPNSKGNGKTDSDDTFSA